MKNQSTAEAQMAHPVPDAPACPPWCPEWDVNHYASNDQGWDHLVDAPGAATKRCDRTIEHMRTEAGDDCHVFVERFACWNNGEGAITYPSSIRVGDWLDLAPAEAEQVARALFRAASLARESQA